MSDMDIYRSYPIEPYSGNGDRGSIGGFGGNMFIRRLLMGRFSRQSMKDAALEALLMHGTRMAWNTIEPRALATFEAVLLENKHADFVKMISHGLQRSVISRTGASDGTTTLVPPRYTVFRYQGAWFFAESEYKITTTVRLYTLRRNTEILEKLREQYFGGAGSKMMRTVTGRGNSRMSLIRPLESVIVSPGIKEHVLGGIERWWTGKEDYARLGRQWKITILLYGQPGCGKSSLERAVAGHYGGDMRVINCADMTDSELHEALRGNERVVVLEDFIPPEEVITEEVTIEADADTGDFDIANTKITKRKRSKLTLAGCLQAFDGADVIHDKIIFINTNYPELMPQKLRREGRVDVFMEMPLPGDAEIRNGFFPMYFPDHKVPDDVVFEPRSGGRIQKCYDLSRGDPEAFIRHVLAAPPTNEDE